MSRKLLYVSWAILAICLLALVWIRSDAVAKTGPVSVANLQVMGQVQPGATISVALELQDTDLATRSVEAVAVSPDGLDRMPVRFAPQKETGQWKAVLPLPATAVPGEWRFADLVAVDDTGKSWPLNSAATFTVPAHADQANFSVEILKGTFRETQILPVLVRATREMELTRALVTVTGPKGQVSIQDVGLFEPKTEWEIPVRLTKGLGAGAWRIARITLYQADGTIYPLLSGRDFDGRLTIAKGREDTTAPTVAQAVITPAAVKTGQRITVEATLQDDIAGADFVSATLVDPSGREAKHLILNHLGAGRWTSEVEFPLYAPAGEWELRLNSRDSAGNEAAQPHVIRFAVSAGYAEAPLPVVESINLEGSSSAVTPTVRVNGAVPVRDLTVSLQGPGTIDPILFPLDLTGPGTWSRTLPMPAHTPAGQWRVTGIMLRDLLGRETELPADALPPGTVMARMEPVTPDGEPPVLQSLTLSAKVVAGERVRAVLKTTDNLAGVEGAMVTLAGPGDQYIPIFLQYELATDSWVGTGLIPVGAPAGTWRSVGVRLVDAAWNATALTEGPGIGSTITVQGR